MDDYPHALSAPSAPGASRRDIIASTDTGIIEASSVDQSLVEAVKENLQLEKLLEQDAAGETPEMLLKHMLSIRSVVSTGSSFAQRQQAAIGTKTSFREMAQDPSARSTNIPAQCLCTRSPCLASLTSCGITMRST